MGVIDRIPHMEPAALDNLEANARRLAADGNADRKLEARAVLDAIDEERKRRTDEERAVAAASPLSERTLRAFSRMPPTDREAAALRAVAENPGADFDVIARHMGMADGAALNLVFGKMCAARERFLGEAPPSDSRPGEKFYSGLIVDLTPHREDGSVWHGWTLKPEAEAALARLGLVRRSRPEAESSAGDSVVP